MHAVELMLEPTLWQDIHAGQQDDKRIKEITELIAIGKAPGFRMDDQGTVWFRKWIRVLALQHIRETILREAHNSAYGMVRRSK